MTGLESLVIVFFTAGIVCGLIWVAVKKDED